MELLGPRRSSFSGEGKARKVETSAGGGEDRTGAGSWGTGSTGGSGEVHVQTPRPEGCPSLGPLKAQSPEFPPSPQGQGACRGCPWSALHVGASGVWASTSFRLQEPGAAKGILRMTRYCRNDSTAQGAPPGATVLAGMTTAGGHQRRLAITMDSKPHST